MHLAAGEPPLPGRDRLGRELPPEWFVPVLRTYAKTSYRIGKWVKRGCPILPNVTMHSRSPAFVIMVLSVFVLGMILPEILGLSHAAGL